MIINFLPRHSFGLLVFQNTLNQLEERSHIRCHYMKKILSGNENFAHNFTVFFVDLFLAFGTPIYEYFLIILLLLYDLTVINLEPTTSVVVHGR
jgi:hypothetical protein